MTRDQKIRRTGLMLTLVAIGLFVYSFVVVKTRGSLPVPTDLTPAQKVLRGL